MMKLFSRRKRSTDGTEGDGQQPAGVVPSQLPGRGSGGSLSERPSNEAVHTSASSTVFGSASDMSLFSGMTLRTTTSAGGGAVPPARGTPAAKTAAAVEASPFSFIHARPASPIDGQAAAPAAAEPEAVSEGTDADSPLPTASSAFPFIASSTVLLEPEEAAVDRGPGGVGAPRCATLLAPRHLVLIRHRIPHATPVAVRSRTSYVAWTGPFTTPDEHAAPPASESERTSAFAFIASNAATSDIGATVLQPTAGAPTSGSLQGPPDQSVSQSTVVAATPPGGASVATSVVRKKKSHKLIRPGYMRDEAAAIGDTTPSAAGQRSPEHATHGTVAHVDTRADQPAKEDLLSLNSVSSTDAAPSEVPVRSALRATAAAVVIADSLVPVTPATDAGAAPVPASTVLPAARTPAASSGTATTANDAGMPEGPAAAGTVVSDHHSVPQRDGTRTADRGPRLASNGTGVAPTVEAAAATAAASASESTPATASAADMSPSERLRAAIAAVDDRLQREGQQVDCSAIRELESLLERQRASFDSAAKRRQELRALEVRQATAIREEDYELADRLSSEMDALQAQLASSSGVAWGSDVAATLSAALVAQREMARQDTAVRQRAVTELQELARVLRSDYEAFRRRFDEDERQRHQRTSAERDRINKLLIHVRNELQRVQQDEEALRLRIDEHTTEERAELQRLESLRGGVRRDMADLEERLRVLRERDATYTRLIEAQQAKLAVAREDVRDESDRLAQSRARCEQDQARLCAELAAVEAECSGLDATAAAYHAKREEYEGSLNAVEQRIEDARHALDAARQERDAVIRFMRDKQRRMEAALVAASELDACRRARAERNAETSEQLERLHRAQDAIATARGRCQEIEARLPELVEEKKQAVASKKFKEAARLAGLMKDLATEKESSGSTLAALEQQRAEAERALQQAQERLAQAEAALLDKEHALGASSSRCRWQQGGGRRAVGADSWCTVLRNRRGGADVARLDAICTQYRQLAVQSREYAIAAAAAAPDMRGGGRRCAILTPTTRCRIRARQQGELQRIVDAELATLKAEAVLLSMKLNQPDPLGGQCVDACTGDGDAAPTPPEADTPLSGTPSGSRWSCTVLMVRRRSVAGTGALSGEPRAGDSSDGEAPETASASAEEAVTNAQPDERRSVADDARPAQSDDTRPDADVWEPHATNGLASNDPDDAQQPCVPQHEKIRELESRLRAAIAAEDYETAGR